MGSIFIKPFILISWRRRKEGIKSSLLWPRPNVGETSFAWPGTHPRSKQLVGCSFLFQDQAGKYLIKEEVERAKKRTQTLY